MEQVVEESTTDVRIGLLAGFDLLPLVDCNDLFLNQPIAQPGRIYIGYKLSVDVMHPPF